MEAYAASVQHDSPLQLHPSSDPAYYKFLVTALSEAQELGVPAEAAAAATAYLCVSDPKASGVAWRGKWCGVGWRAGLVHALFAVAHVVFAVVHVSACCDTRPV